MLLFFCMSFCNSFSSDVTSKTVISLILRNPEVVFVADLTRANAPALVLSTQCELFMKSCAEGSQITAVINDLKVRRGKCIILGGKVWIKYCFELLDSKTCFICRLWHVPSYQRRGKIIWPPCCSHVRCFSRARRRHHLLRLWRCPWMPSHWRYLLLLRIHKARCKACCSNTSIKLVYACQVSPLIINTMITILSVLSPAAETPEELDSPVSINLWEKQSWKELKFWFLEEDRDEDPKSVVPLVPKDESLLVLFYI